MKISNVRLLCFFALIAVVGISCSDNPVSVSGDQSGDQKGKKVNVPPEKVRGKRTVRTQNGEYTAIKYRDDDGNEKEIFLDKDGKVVEPGSMGEDVPSNPIGDDLKEAIDNADSATKASVVELIVVLKTEVKPPEVEGYSVSIDDKGTILINGKPATQADLDKIEKEQEKVRADFETKRKEKKEKVLDTLIKRNGLHVSEEVIDDYLNGGDLVLSMPLGEVEDFHKKNEDLILFIVMKPRTSDSSLVSAMEATDVKRSVLPHESHWGYGVGVYMTEGQCSDYISDERQGGTGDYDRGYNYGVLNQSSCNAPHPLNVASIIRAVSPGSFIYCRSGAELPKDDDLANADPAISVVSASFRYVVSQTGYTYSDSKWDDFIYSKRVLAVVAAGNEGYGDQYVTPPSRGLNVLTVGNYDDRNGAINQSSSWRDPSNTQNSKPEVSAPGTYIDAGYQLSDRNKDVRKIIMTGTSQAAPHVSGIVADLTGRYSALRGRPHLQKAFVMGGAYDPVSGGRDRVGVGGVDATGSLYNFTYQWWEGGNSSFDWFDKRDRLPNNHKIDYFKYLSGGQKVRIVLTWLNRGSWTYSHRNSKHPIGMDLDISIYDSSGRYVAGSGSYDNGFEVAEFTPATSGEYRIAISRFSNRDTYSDLRMALFVKYL